MHGGIFVDGRCEGKTHWEGSGWSHAGDSDVEDSFELSSAGQFMMHVHIEDLYKDLLWDSYRRICYRARYSLA